MIELGFGDQEFNFAVYIGNKPNMNEYQGLALIQPLLSGEIELINQACGNGWRKVFNVYAKLLYSLDNQYYDFSKLTTTWQALRDNYLLQNQSRTALLFSAPRLSPKSSVVHVICGKSHAKKLISEYKLMVNLIWLDHEFAIDAANKVIICPYFDYRQLSNVKIERLSALISSLKQQV